VGTFSSFAEDSAATSVTEARDVLTLGTKSTQWQVIDEMYRTNESNLCTLMLVESADARKQRVSMVRRRQPNDELWLELLKKNLQDLESLRLIDESTGPISELKESLKTTIAELKPAIPIAAEPLNMHLPGTAARLRRFQFSTCLAPTNALLRHSRELINTSRERLHRTKTVLAGRTRQLRFA
jgi:hypothetical protein